MACPKCGSPKCEEKNGTITFTCGSVYIKKNKKLLVGYECLKLQLENLINVSRKLLPDILQFASFSTNVEEIHAQTCDCDLGTQCPRYKQVKSEMEAMQKNVTALQEMVRLYTDNNEVALFSQMPV